jgi:hypothetical protein
VGDPKDSRSLAWRTDQPPVGSVSILTATFETIDSGEDLDAVRRSRLRDAGHPLGFSEGLLALNVVTEGWRCSAIACDTGPVMLVGGLAATTPSSVTG